MIPYIESNLSARTLNRQQASLTERAGKLSLPVNQSVKGKAGPGAVSEQGIALSDSEGQRVETLPAAQFTCGQCSSPDLVVKHCPAGGSGKPTILLIECRTCGYSYDVEALTKREGR
jgi:DNA-directed RNA polymerase subunit M/transcription elongation factor TFIIS